ncbi:hypothetical protein FRC08_005910 [Ceratobasidium sp. 394]|nr:hypothetical protein FRC08_005910 [Ceratobasidium sp. 394]
MAAASFDNLPADILLIILAHSTINSVRQCRKVCRSLRDFIDTNHYLQYKLELDACGYVEPLHPRTDLNYSAKTKMLRKHNARWSNPQRITPVRYELPGYDMDDINTFTKGTFVWDQDVGDQGKRLMFYQLPSANRGTKFKQWSIDLANGHRGFWIDPEQDLLVVAEARDGFLGGVLYNLHMRSMSTNQPHPRAVPGRTVLCYTPPSDPQHYRGQVIRIFHHLLVGLFNPWDDMVNIVIWNWTTGQELSHLTVMDRRVNHFVELLNENSFVICRSLTPPDVDPNSPTNTLGWLSVYQFDPQAAVSEQATHIVSFTLPASQIENYRWYTLRLDPVPATAPPNAQDHHNSPAEVYNLAHGDRLLRVVHHELTGSPPPIPVEAFHVPSSVLLDELTKCVSQPTPKLVPWVEWADRVVRIAHSKSYPWDSSTHTFGLRMISMPRLDYGAWPFEIPSFDITVFDLHQRRLMSRGIRRPYSKLTIPLEHITLADIERWIEEGYQLPEEAEEYNAWIDEEHCMFLTRISVYAN